MKRPNFFISGAPRCGTTALYTYLSEHPRVFVSEVKELNYFAADFPHLHKIAFRSEADYLRLFQKSDERHLAVGEASPFYLYSEVAFERMRAFDPQAKVLLTLRNPVDFIHSYHQLNLSLLREDEPDLAKAWDLQDARRRGEHLPPGAREPRLLLYGEMGRFSVHLQRLQKFFPPQQVKIFLFDDFRRNPRQVYEETLAFLNVPSDGRTVFPQINAGFGNRSALLARVFHPPQPVYRALMRLVSVFGPVFMKNAFRLYDRLERMNTRKADRAALDPALRERLTAYFRPDIEILAELIDRDLSHWLSGDPA